MAGGERLFLCLKAIPPASPVIGKAWIGLERSWVAHGLFMENPLIGIERSLVATLTDKA